MELSGSVQGMIDLMGGGSDVEVSQVLSSGEKIAIISVDNVPTDIYAPSPTAPTDVKVSQVVSSGNKIATISVDGVPTDIYIKPLIFSLVEREVGVWVDNKPLYQKTTHFGAISTNANYGLTMDIGVNIADTVIGMFANAKVSSGTWVMLPYPLPNANYAAYLDGYNELTDKLIIKTGHDRSFVEGYATLYYTKTTD